MQGLPPKDIGLPVEILVLVCPYLSKKDQLCSRLVSHKLHYAATIHVFRLLRLKPDGDSPLQLREIALSYRLRTFVKDVVIDTELDRSVSYPTPKAAFDACQKFLLFLPYLCLLNNLRHLHVRFMRSSDEQGSLPFQWWYFRYMVLDIISHCVTGMWTPANRKKIYDTLPPEGQEMFRYTQNEQVLQGNSSRIKEFTISHLADYNDLRLIQSRAWNQLLRLPTLIDLKLLVGENHIGKSTTLSAERYEFCSALPSQWLTPDVVQKLQVLSLFYTDYWGLYPRVDLDQFGALPSLKVLALGRYVFTDKKDTDWIASLGKNNKTGGVEELYLDECCVLFQAKQYVDFEAVLGTVPDQNAAMETNLYSRRWHHVLSERRVSMKGLKKFVMGVGDWGCPFRTRQFWENQMSPLTKDILADPPEWYFGHNRHRFFANPEPENFGRGFLAAYHSRSHKSKEIRFGNYLLGEGLRQRRGIQMEYAWYNVRLFFKWSIGNHHEDSSEDVGWAPEEETRDLDDAAYALLMETIRNRLRS